MERLEKKYGLDEKNKVNKAEDMERCKLCKNKIDLTEVYGDWFYCRCCKKELTYHRERLNPEDALSVCDSPNPENK